MEIILAVAARKFVQPPPDIADFLEWVEAYQSNHYGNFDSQGFRDAYFRLPAEIREIFRYNKRGFLYRGDEFYREDLYQEYRAGKHFPALSFSPNKGVAEHFGDVRKFGQIVKDYKGQVDTDNLVRWCNKNRFEHDIGDDEGEVIMVDVTLK